MFTRDQIEEIKKKLIMLGTKDTQFPDAHKLNGEEIIAIVQDGESRKIPLSSIVGILSDISVSPNDDFINASKGTTVILTLDTAVSKVDINNRKLGQVITFKDSANSWATYQFVGNSLDNWRDTSLWKSISGIDELKSQADTNTNNISSLNTEVSTLQSKVDVNTTGISKNKVAIEKNTSDIKNVSDTVDAQAAKLNDVNTTLENALFKNKGYFTTLEKLNEAIPNPTIGSKAYVGTSEPYAIYIVENGVWVDSGYTGGDEIVANITTNRIEDGAVTSEKIATSAFDSTLSVSGKIAPADVVGEKLTELENNVSSVRVYGSSTDNWLDVENVIGGCISDTTFKFIDKIYDNNVISKPIYVGDMQGKKICISGIPNASMVILYLKSPVYENDNIISGEKLGTKGTWNYSIPEGTMFICVQLSVFSAGDDYSNMKISKTEGVPATEPYSEIFLGHVNHPELFGKMALTTEYNPTAEDLKDGMLNQHEINEGVNARLVTQEAKVVGVISDMSKKVSNSEFRDYQNEVSKDFLEVKDNFSSLNDNVQHALNEYRPLNLTNNGTINNNADNEDLVSVDGVIKFKNRASDSVAKGYVILRADVPLSSQLVHHNTIYSVRYVHNLEGATIPVPVGCELVYDGGKIVNGVLSGSIENKVLDTRMFDDAVVFENVNALISDGLYVKFECKHYVCKQRLLIRNNGVILDFSGAEIYDEIDTYEPELSDISGGKLRYSSLVWLDACKCVEIKNMIYYARKTGSVYTYGGAVLYVGRSGDFNGVSGCSIHDIMIVGREGSISAKMGGITVTGESHNIDIHNISFRNLKLMSGINCEYGLSDSGTKQGKHPHNIRINNIVGINVDTEFIRTSSAYNIAISNVKCENVTIPVYAYCGDKGCNAAIQNITYENIGIKYTSDYTLSSINSPSIFIMNVANEDGSGYGLLEDWRSFANQYAFKNIIIEYETSLPNSCAIRIINNRSQVYFEDCIVKNAYLPLLVENSVKQYNPDGSLSDEYLKVDGVTLKNCVFDNPYFGLRIGEYINGSRLIGCKIKGASGGLFALGICGNEDVVIADCLFYKCTTAWDISTRRDSGTSNVTQSTGVKIRYCNTTRNWKNNVNDAFLEGSYDYVQRCKCADGYRDE